MHQSSFDLMKRLIKRHVGAAQDGGMVLDVGSRKTRTKDKSLRDMFKSPSWIYMGLDIRDGENVDFVVNENEQLWPDRVGWYDAIVSANALEHCRRPWQVIDNMARHVHRHGFVIVCAPFMWHVHEHPGDYFRFTGSGLASMMDDSGLHVVESGQKSSGGHEAKADAWAVGTKR